MSVILEARDVTKEYRSEAGAVRAVDSVSLSLSAGEFIAVVGPSGSGKTTLLALLAGLLSPTSGTVLIGGADVAGLREADRARFRRENIGFSFQANNLVPYLTVRENVELACRLKGSLTRDDRRRVVELLERLGLGEKLESLPSQLSGGQQQRVSIARSLAHSPLIVLADEPTASLDTERGRQVVQAFGELIKEQGRAGVMVTHDMRMVQYTTAVIRMVDGKVADFVRDRHGIEMLSGMHGRASGMSRSLEEREVARRGALEIAG